MINTIFYFVKDYDTYKQTVREQGISSRTIVFVAKERLILKEGTPYGGVGDDGLVEVFTKLMGDYFTSTISPYIFDQIAHLDLDTKWEQFDEFENRINSAMSSIQLLTSQIENFISLQATRNTEMQEAIAGLNTRISTVDGRITTVQNDLIAQLSDLGDDIEDNTTAISELRQSINTVDGKVDSVTNSLTTNITNVAGDLITQRISGLVSLADLNEAMASLFAASNNSKEAPKDLLNPLWLDTPIDTTDEYPYLWMKVENEGALYYVRITNGDHTWDNVGMCVDAQFTSDPTVAEPVIHDIYESGDFYMRTKLPTETEYGEWVLISSETTFPVYSFNLSKNPATGFAQIMIDVNAEGASTVNISGDQVIIEGRSLIDYITEQLNITADDIWIKNTNGGTICKIDSSGKAQFADGLVYINDYTANVQNADSYVAQQQLIPNGIGINIKKSTEYGGIKSYLGPDEISWQYTGKDYWNDGWTDTSTNTWQCGRIYFEQGSTINNPQCTLISTVSPLGRISDAVSISMGTSYTSTGYSQSADGVTLGNPVGNVTILNSAKTSSDQPSGTMQVSGFSQYNNNSTNSRFYGDVRIDGGISVGSNAGITQTISIPAGTGQHYSMTIENGIITDCSLVND